MSKTNVSQWLESLGLGRYDQAFAENAIGPEHLAELDHDTLKEIGVRAVGHRLSLLKAARDIESSPGAEMGREASVVTPVPFLPPDAERRQLTVMFCDLARSTELSVRLGPEKFRDVILAYQDACTPAIERYGGYIARYFGDGMLVYFGYPRAHEDDVERAAHAGLELIQAIGSIGSGRCNPADIDIDIAVRIGIETGPVVVGDLVGEGAAQERTVFGETPNLAARLQGVAAPNSVIVGPRTRHLLGTRFLFEELGNYEFKGIAGSVPASRVTDYVDAESRFDTRRRAGVIPIVGRNEETDLLSRRWEQAVDGEGQVVLLCGEPGIGKSRIVQAIQERLAQVPHTRLRYQCSPYYTNSALYPIIKQLERAAGLNPDDKPEQAKGKLRALLRQSVDDVTRYMPSLVDLLSIESADETSTAVTTPQQMKEDTLDALVKLLGGLAERSPVLMLFEDVHWLDPTTDELLGRILERVRTSRVLLVITFRPEFSASWGLHAHVTSLTLNRLSRRQCGSMIRRLTAGKPLPAPVLDQILAKTDGIPLFVEELTKMVLESELLIETNDRYEMEDPLPPLEIPSTLHDSLAARLNHLAPVKRVAQIGAALGRSFSYELLAAVAPLRELELQEALSHLEESELLFRCGTPPKSIYEFKHALIQDVAYESMLNTDLQKLHGHIATLLESKFPTTVETEPETLAHHYTLAGLTEKGIRYWQLAGKRAVQHSANAEAIAHFQKALDRLSILPESYDRTCRKIDLHVALGVPLIAARGYAHPEVLETYTQARRLCDQLHDSSRLFPVLWGLWTCHRARLEMQTARDLAADLVDLAGRQKDHSRLLAAHHAQWTTQTYLGDAVAAIGHAERGIGLYDSKEHHSHVFVYGGHDPGVCGLSTHALNLWIMGYPEQAVQRISESIALARKLEHPPTVVHAMIYSCILSQFHRDAEATLTQSTEAFALAASIDQPGYGAAASMLRGWASAGVDRGAALANAEIVSRELACGQFMVVGVTRAYFSCVLADTYLQAGDLDSFFPVINSAIDEIAHNGMRLWEPETHRARGDALSLLAGDKGENAEASLRRAIEIAGAQKAKSLELRATNSLCRMLKRKNRLAEVRACLTPTYEWFTEGLDTADLQEAGQLLEAVS